MTSLIYNFSVVILLLGLILMVYYTTKIYYEKDTNLIIKEPPSIYDSYVYQERPYTLFKNMFNNLGPWIGRVPNYLDETADDVIKIKQMTSLTDQIN
ncbi:hypothetical protein crov340 [Cafeteria roenbergensis virus]|uniref:Uncharacterized protein n=1 Tax=Cafeteria roenbergensis virus (strain BV-PW1) TaxID=693272 RepID=E3T5B1_CROVB|nr:hypothetical protein crov340 [Cafeteria roenbergensis virus BV-PW1]ADO67374.1 hypothetical protein crov340 [Cafeteria roenbergensis virus BV-PW1]